MNLLALDLSLTSTGWAAAYPVASGTFCPQSRGAQRLADAAAWLDRMLDLYRPELVLLEGYSFGSRFTRAHALGELGGVVRLGLHRRGVPMLELAPKVRAKLATGKGNAGKEQVLAEAIRRLGYAGHSNDEADALWLLQAALIHYQLPGGPNLPRVNLPKAHLDAITDVEWPARRIARAS